MGTTHYYLLYDEDCRLCKWYTATFVKHGFLQEDARLPYHRGIEDARFEFDIDRARSEIALVNDVGAPVRYGLDSLLFVLGRKWKWVEVVGRFAPVNFALRNLYALISYNRKILSPVVCTTGCQCDPPYSSAWRFSLILICGLLTQLLVSGYFSDYFEDYTRINLPMQELLLFSLQFAFQYGAFRLLGYRDFKTYAGHLAVVSLIGALALGIIHAGIAGLAAFGWETQVLQTTGFGMVLGIMLLEHARRVRRLGYAHWLTLSWFVFRLVVYPFIFKF